MTIEGLIDLAALNWFKQDMKEWVRKFRQHTEVCYVGIGLADDSFTMEPYEVSQISVTNVEVLAEGHYIYLLYPKTCETQISMSGMAIPMVRVGDTTIATKDYWIYRSTNTYADSLKIELILKV